MDRLGGDRVVRQLLFFQTSQRAAQSAGGRGPCVGSLWSDHPRVSGGGGECRGSERRVVLSRAGPKSHVAHALLRAASPLVGTLWKWFFAICVRMSANTARTSACATATRSQSRAPRDRRRSWN